MSGPASSPDRHSKGNAASDAAGASSWVADVFRAVATLGVDRVLGWVVAEAQKLHAPGFRVSLVSAFAGVGLIYLYGIVIAVLAVVSTLSQQAELPGLDVLFPGLIIATVFLAVCVAGGIVYDRWYPAPPRPLGTLCHAHRDQILKDLKFSLEKLAHQQGMLEATMNNRMGQALQNSLAGMLKQRDLCAETLEKAVQMAKEVGSSVGICQVAQ